MFFQIFRPSFFCSNIKGGDRIIDLQTSYQEIGGWHLKEGRMKKNGLGRSGRIQPHGKKTAHVLSVELKDGSRRFRVKVREWGSFFYLF